MREEDVPTGAPLCEGCGSELAPSLLSCPHCQRLVHGEELKRLAAEAEEATRAGHVTGAMEQWRRALELLPPSSRQHSIITAKLEALAGQLGAWTGPAPVSTTTPGPEQGAEQPASGIGREGVAGSSGTARPSASGSRGKAILTGAGAIGLLIWKFKFVAALLLTKGKLLLLGLTKASTLLSMMASLGVYWTQWGWKFALGVVVSIYIHEMGHVAALRKCGLPASSPMFIPGVGAFVRLKQRPSSPREDATIGLAGPVWGLAGVIVTWMVALAASWPSWSAIAHVAAWVNLFNLVPVWQLDGSRGFGALSRGQRWLVVGAIAAMWFFTAEGLLLLLLIVAGGRTLIERGASTPDRSALTCFLAMVVVLSVFAMPGGFRVG